MKFNIVAGGNEHIALIGGNWNNGSKAGLGNVNLNNDAGNSNQNIGGRLKLRMFSGEGTFYEQFVSPHRYQVEYTAKSHVRLVCESTERLARMFLPNGAML